MSEKRQNKVLKLRIVKPVNMTWDELGQILRQVQYRVWRLANLYLSEQYSRLAERERLAQITEQVTGLLRQECGEEIFANVKDRLAKKLKASERGNLGELNRRLAGQLVDEARRPKKAESQFFELPAARICETGGALRSYVTDALQSKLDAESKGDKWKQVLKGERSLPTYRRSMPIPIRGGWLPKPKFTPLQRRVIGDREEVLFVPRICEAPLPELIVSVPERDQGAKATLEKLLQNPDQHAAGFRQRAFEIVRSRRDNKWYLHVSYDFPAAESKLDPGRVVGVDVGFSCPLYAAVLDGPQRLGEREFAALGQEVRRLRLRTISRRRALQRAGRVRTENEARKPARSGHGVTRKLLPTERLQGRVDDAQKTLNHRMSAAVVNFAFQQGCGIIQIEDLAGLSERLSGTFLGANWRYHELLNFIDYKARAAGMLVRKIKPRYSSRRCADCGWINAAFSREFRDGVRRATGRPAMFECLNPECAAFNKPVHADYNAARNLATLDLEKLIRRQCRAQGVPYGTPGDEVVETEEESAKM